MEPWFLFVFFVLVHGLLVWVLLRSLRALLRSCPAPGAVLLLTLPVPGGAAVRRCGAVSVCPAAPSLP